MILKDLIDKSDFNDVMKEIVHFYKEQEKNEDGYKLAFYDLKNRKDITIEEKEKWELVFEEVIEDDITYYNVCGSCGDGKLYSIELSNWNFWLNLEIPDIIISKLSNEKIVALCLYELTFFGYEEKNVEKMHNDLAASYEEAVKSIDINQIDLVD